MKSSALLLCLPLCLTLSLVLCGCAKPKYQDAAPTSPPSDNSAAGDPAGDKPSTQSCVLFFSQQHLCVELKWKAKAVQGQFGEFTLSFFAEGHPETAIEPRHTPAVQLWMTSMNHGSSPVTVSKVSEGVYEATKVYFVMGGEWDIRIQLKDNNEIIEQVVQKITL
jgi:hypothetical protein